MTVDEILSGYIVLNRAELPDRTGVTETVYAQRPDFTLPEIIKIVSEEYELLRPYFSDTAEARLARFTG